MKNIYEVMHQKEADIERLKQELQALRIAAPLLEAELAPEMQKAQAPAPMRYPTPPANGANAKSIWP